MDIQPPQATLPEEPGTTDEILAAILDQGRGTLELFKAVLSVLAPY
jgi:hypothetical protein